jgi:hypothetical protein
LSYLSVNPAKAGIYFRDGPPGLLRRCDETGVWVVVASRGCRGDNLWLGPSDRAIFIG